MVTHASTTDVSTLEPLSQSAVRLVPYAFTRDARLLVARQDVDTLEVWVCPETSRTVLAELGRVFGVLHLVTLDMTALSTATQTAYNAQDGSATQVVDEVEGEVDLSRLMQDIPAVEDLLGSGDDAPITRMINALPMQTVREGAPDTHTEPFENASVARFRVDGMPRDVVRPKKALHGALTSRAKIMAQLDIVEKRLLQDGCTTLRVGGYPVDVRASTLLTGHGERAVLRLLGRETGQLDLGKFGIGVGTLARFDHPINQPHDIVLATGLTGSGKMITLYTALSRLDAVSTNITTVEDPIEHNPDDIDQTQTNPEADMTFVKALRVILRQDPDVVMIGEIRDLETVQIAVQASLTGHLVLATPYTSDSASAAMRLTDMGIKLFLLSPLLLGALAQRSVCRLYVHCRRGKVLGLTPAEVEVVAGAPIADGVASAASVCKPVWYHVGCECCSSSGYQGRIGVYELPTVTPEIQTMIYRQAVESEIKAFTIGQGMQTIRMDAQCWTDTGATSLEEMLRVTRD